MASVLREPGSNKSRGFGFITFDTVEATNNALGSQHHIIDGRKVEVKLAVPKSKMDEDDALLGNNNMMGAGDRYNNNNSNNDVENQPRMINPNLQSARATRSISITSNTSSTVKSSIKPNNNNNNNNNNATVTKARLPTTQSMPSIVSKVNPGFMSPVADVSAYNTNSSNNNPFNLDSEFQKKPKILSTPLSPASSINTEYDRYPRNHPSLLSPSGSVSQNFNGFSLPTPKFRSLSIDSQQQQQQMTQGPIVENKIFVGGLLYATTRESLRQYFEKYGTIESAEVIYNKETKKSRGFGFVIFKDHSSLEKVLKEQDDVGYHKVDGKEVEIKYCVARQESPARNMFSERILSTPIVDRSSSAQNQAMYTNSVPRNNNGNGFMSPPMAATMLSARALDFNQSAIKYPLHRSMSESHFGYASTGNQQDISAPVNDIIYDSYPDQTFNPNDTMMYQPFHHQNQFIQNGNFFVPPNQHYMPYQNNAYNAPNMNQPPGGYFSPIAQHPGSMRQPVSSDLENQYVHQMVENKNQNMLGSKFGVGVADNGVTSFNHKSSFNRWGSDTDDLLPSSLGDEFDHFANIDKLLDDE